MSEQASLFHESMDDALREIVRCLGGSKAVGKQMRPEKTMEDASRWISDCLNADRREKFDTDQILWLLREARKVNCHAAINYICAQAGYSEPLPIDPEDEKAKLQRMFMESVQAQSKIVERMEQLNKNSLRAVA